MAKDLSLEPSSRDCTWCCRHTEQAWVQSNRGKSSPATRLAWPLQFLHLHRGGSVEFLGTVQQYMHDTMGQKECESIDVIQQLHDWAFPGVEMVTALLSSTPAVAERPATPLSTGATRPGGPLNIDFSHSSSSPQNSTPTRREFSCLRRLISRP